MLEAAALSATFVACGICTYWILVLLFPATPSWIVLFSGWFLLLSVVRTAIRTPVRWVPHVWFALPLLVACFLVGAAGRYLEVELGAGGHFLVLSFAGPRDLADAHESLELAVELAGDSHGWRAGALLGWDLVPARIEALNAFVIASGAHLAFARLPGAQPDFHQPALFPRAVLASRT